MAVRSCSLRQVQVLWAHTKFGVHKHRNIAEKLACRHLSGRYDIGNHDTPHIFGRSVRNACMQHHLHSIKGGCVRFELNPTGIACVIQKLRPSVQHCSSCRLQRMGGDNRVNFSRMTTSPAVRLPGHCIRASSIMKKQSPLLTRLCSEFYAAACTWQRLGTRTMSRVEELRPFFAKTLRELQIGYDSVL